MDQGEHQEGRQDVLHFECKKIVEEQTATQKPGNLGTQKLVPSFASQTPQKTTTATNHLHSLQDKCDGGEFEIPERFKTIVDLFDGFCCSLRLLGLRKKSPTFQNMGAQIEVLTNRKFSYGNLAQIKYLLPEALQIDKILVHDKKTLCMKPDMKIVLLFDVVEGHNEPSDFIAVRRVFASRLLNYLTEHPEACDIPEVALPAPFNQNHNTSDDKAQSPPEVVIPEPPSQRCQIVVPEELPASSSGPSHLHPSFSRYFSQKMSVDGEEKTPLLASPLPSSEPAPSVVNNHDCKINATREFPGSTFDNSTNTEIKDEPGKECPGTSSAFISSEPVEQMKPQISIDSGTCESPMGKVGSAVGGLILETPAQTTPKRAMPSCDDKQKRMESHKQTSSSKPTKRSLDFSRLEGDKCVSYSRVNDSGFYESLDDNVTQTRDVPPSLAMLKVEVSSGLLAKEQQTSVCLPDLVSLIHNVFRSVNYSPMTKEELVYKILVTSFDFSERREVEEHIDILEKLVPDWICRKLAPSGDALYNIKKISDLNYVQTRVIGI